MIDKLYITTVIPKKYGFASANILYNKIFKSGTSLIVFIGSFSKSEIFENIKELKNIEDIILINNKNLAKKIIYKLIIKYKIKEIQYFDYHSLYIANIKSKNIKKNVWLGDLRFEVLFFGAFELGFFKGLYFLTINFHKIIFDIVRLKYYSNFVDSISVCSQYTYKRLLSLGIKSTFENIDYNENITKFANCRNKLQLVFFGNLVGLGSRSGIRNLKILVDKYKNDVQFNVSKIVIFGRTKMLEEEELTSNYKNIENIGFVDNLSEVLAVSLCALIPISVPVGIRTRVITCLQLGLPVMIYKEVAGGNPNLIHNYNCIIFDNNNFVYYLNKLRNNQNYWNNISKNSIDTYNKYYRP